MDSAFTSSSSALCRFRSSAIALHYTTPPTLHSTHAFRLVLCLSGCPLPFWLSSPQGICFCPRRCLSSPHRIGAASSSPSPPAILNCQLHPKDPKCQSQISSKDY